jgi:hypothetical protein
MNLGSGAGALAVTKVAATGDWVPGLGRLREWDAGHGDIARGATITHLGAIGYS